MIERGLNPTQLDDWFSATAEQQYTKDLLFSTVFDVVSHVVYGKQPSIHAAYQASKAEVGVSVTSLYNKLNGIEPNTAAELVRYASRQVEPVIKKIGGTSRSPLPGLRIKLLDGNCIEKSQHRIQELRFTSAGPLPGKSLVVYDPVLRLPIDVFPCEDGHAQERCLLKAVLGTVESGDVWIADRNFCTVEFTCGIESRGSYFAIREHKLYPSRVLSWNNPEKTAATMLGGWLDTGDTYIRDEDGYYLYCGRNDDMMKVGGIWCSPFEIEAKLIEHPKVLEAAVVGRADDDELI
jgi:hypothetical protein